MKPRHYLAHRSSRAAAPRVARVGARADVIRVEREAERVARVEGALAARWLVAGVLGVVVDAVLAGGDECVAGAHAVHRAARRLGGRGARDVVELVASEAVEGGCAILSGKVARWLVCAILSGTVARWLARTTDSRLRKCRRGTRSAGWRRRGRRRRRSTQTSSPRTLL